MLPPTDRRPDVADVASDTETASDILTAETVDTVSECATVDAAPSAPPAPCPPPRWPAKRDVFGVGISPTTYAEAAECVVRAGARRESAVVGAFAVHAVVTASGDPQLRAAVNRFEMITPDGQPVRWALNLLHACGLKERVYGPTLTLEICRLAAERGVPVFLYGGAEHVTPRLAARLRKMFPALKIAGAMSPPFRSLGAPEQAEDDRRAVEAIEASGAGIVLIGLGCPKQDFLAARLRDRLHAVQVCVGAAFDFHAGVKPVAPRWMQNRGLEWFYRLASEPQRLWKRYLVTNSQYLGKLGLALSNLPRTRRQRRAGRRAAAKASF
ncbi:WecB/TagA/CpsF family glycosyltransferase [Alienimonas californiensis]|uniref:UDP-N-acetyl-D-mannosaminuronic acid transferase n=1 Tax=Alienimonas californiensis TaxID=2527989 RepID=A0A517P464_9PLAN|nr:WecB/TagA/CpsF family glycosyltransferase [Alienimonas californiensis]QDT14135.1 UDP-N-acetyl-D-mannosaminuronic acid transferase [Alienimonas californiensis]